MTQTDTEKLGPGPLRVPNLSNRTLLLMTGKLLSLILLSAGLGAGQTLPNDSAAQPCQAISGGTPDNSVYDNSGYGNTGDDYAGYGCQPASNSTPGLNNNLQPKNEENLLPQPEYGVFPGTRNMAQPSPGLQGNGRRETEPSSLAPGPARNPVFGPITRRTEFEIFADEEAGRFLPVYGRRIFDQAPRNFAPLDNVPVPAGYMVGAGDELLIHVWGKIELDSRLVVDRNGQVFVPKVGTLTVAGLRYDQLQGFVHAAIAQLYKDFDVNVTLGKLRSIQILVVGSARQPGTYTISSMGTLADALFASGGPSATGSMRHILLRRAGRDVVDFDIYDLLRRGDKSHDVQLLPGDVVFIPPAGPQVALIGSVSEPGIYELRSVEPLAALLADAGGATSLANENRVLLERIQDHAERQVESFPLDASGLNQILRDGDLLRVYPLSPRFDNAVTLRGNVAQPGRYVWHEGMRVSDLIPSRQFLLSRNYWNQQNFLVPATQDNPFGLSREQLNGPVSDATTVAASRTRVQVQQTMADPSRQTSFERARNDEEINWDYASIERLDERDLSTRVLPFNLAKSIDDPASPDNQLLKPGDVVTVFSRKDLPLPEDKEAMFVRVAGEVNAPGVYRVYPGENLRQLVRDAGGLTPHSYLFASQLTRVSTRLAEEQQLTQSIQQMQTELASRYAAAPALNSANTAEQQAQFTSQQAMLNQLMGAQPTGRVVLDMKPTASTIDDIPPFSLENGDSFYIPPRMGTVQVAGTVYNPNAFRYQRGKRLFAYLNDAGGPTRQADKKRIFLIRADGTVVGSQAHADLWGGDFGRTIVLPGDAIIVPPRLKSPNGFAQQLPFLTQILSQTALTGAVISSAY